MESGGFGLDGDRMRAWNGAMAGLRLPQGVPTSRAANRWHLGYCRTEAAT